MNFLAGIPLRFWQEIIVLAGIRARILLLVGILSENKFLGGILAGKKSCRDAVRKWQIKYSVKILVSKL